MERKHLSNVDMAIVVIASFVGLLIAIYVFMRVYDFWYARKKQKSTIFLPVNDKGEPDLEFMENYMKSLRYSKEIETFSVTT